MPHPSDNDPNPHSSVLFQNDKGWEVCKAHVVPDQNKQEVGPSLTYTQMLYDNEMTNFPNSRLVKSGDCDALQLQDLLVR
jgi:hypothetical protein